MRIILFLVFGAGIWLFLIFPLDGVAEIYYHVDKNGVRHFTNIPMASVGKPVIYKSWKSRRSSLPTRAKRYSSKRYDDYIQDACRRHELSFHLLKAVIKVESDFDPYAVSVDGALGLMQIMPANVKHLSVSDPFNPRENINAGARYLKNMLRRFNGNISLSLAAYNAGPGAVEKYKTIPPYKETKNYVKRVLRYYSLYKKNG